MSKLPIPFSNPKTYKGHSGVDFGQPLGTPFRASGPGVIVTRSSNQRGGFYVWVRYDNGPKIGYHHMDSHRGVPKVGARVSEGSLLGYVGNTGNSTGPHLHSECSCHGTTDGYWQHFDRNTVVGAKQRIVVNRNVKDVQRAVGVTVDGIWGPKTEAAVKAFQKGHGLTADGIWGAKTDAAAFPPAKPASGTALIRKVQSKLKTVYPLYAGKLVVDGIQGPKTTAAIKEFQRRSGLTADGIVGPKTRKALGL